MGNWTCGATAYLAELRTSYSPVRAPPVLPPLLLTQVGATIHPVVDKFAESHHLVRTDPRRHADVPPARFLFVIRKPFWLARVVQPVRNTTLDRVVVPAKLSRLEASRPS